MNFPYQNPNANPNPYPNPNPNINPNPSDLSTTLSSLKTLISFCHQTLRSPKILPPKPQDDSFIPCPYNPHHLMPPESLFLHTLRCPFPLEIDPPNYQNTLQSSSLLRNQEAHFTIQDPDQELCFSLNDYLSIIGSPRFFYQDCPAVVSLSDVDASSAKKTLTLPGILSIECANVVCFNNKDAKKKIDGFYEVGFGVLGSDLWFIRREVETWRDFEHINMYSFNIACAILGLRVIRESDLNKCIIVNSPRFGVVIDVYMGDHISVLVGLCLKAVVREAFGFLELVKRQELERTLESMSFKCPALNQVLMWLSSQLSVLYGHVNGKFFATEIFKECLLESASRFLLPLGQGLTKSSCLEEGDQSSLAKPSDIGDVEIKEPLERSTKCELDARVDETVNSKVIFVSQVAAAVAALHERSLLEVKIRRLRGSQQLTSYQRMAEHAYLSSQADEERKKRHSYRRIIEHDGLPWQQPSREETNKTKSREELLAEERDYKRRRMSYRGKKVKRTNLQVVRDIIDEYMEQIKEAGGIGRFEKGDQDRVAFPSKSPSHDRSRDAGDDRKTESNLFEAARGSPNYYQKLSNNDRDFKSTSIKGALHRDREQSQGGLHGDCGRLEELRSSIDRKKDGYYSRSTERRQSRGQAHEPSSHRGEREDIELTRTKNHEVKRPSFSSSDLYDSRLSYSASNSRLRKRHDDHGTHSPMKNAFEDRYDPSESHSQEMYEDDFSSGGKGIKPE